MAKMLTEMVKVTHQTGNIKREGQGQTLNTHFQLLHQGTKLIP